MEAHDGRVGAARHPGKGTPSKGTTQREYGSCSMWGAGGWDEIVTVWKVLEACLLLDGGRWRSQR